MKSFLKNQINKVKDNPPPASDPSPAPSVSPVTQQDVYQYRYHFGSNLGSIFVLEKWLYSRMFASSAGGGSEHDAVTAALQSSDLDSTRTKWEQHWSSALSDSDLTFLAGPARCTTIRLPVGYFTLGPRFCPPGTPFHGAPSQVYVNAWRAVLDLCGRLAGAGIGVLLDLHALPGGANNDAHSGSSGCKAMHWQYRSLRDLSKACLEFMAGEIAAGNIPNATGLQLCNEACHNAANMYDWYEDVIASIHRIAPGLPVYVSDAWDLKTAVKWAAGMNAAKHCGATNPVVVDTHKYYTFGEKDRSSTPREIIGRVPTGLQAAEEAMGSVHDKGAVQCFVGEWSAVLDERTWKRVGEGEKEGLAREFAQAQTRTWERVAGGHAFWTAKMQWMDGGGWGFVAQVKKGNVVPPAYTAAGFEEVQGRLAKAAELKAEMVKGAVDAHVGYWDKTSPGKKFEHWRFEQGAELGWDDAVAFAGMRGRWEGRMGDRGMDRIGMLETWVWKRMGESGGKSPFMWEWEQGFRQGVKAVEGVLGI